MKGSVNNRDNIIQVQGDRVLVLKNGEKRVFTFVHLVSETGHELRLVNREVKAHKPDWEVSQKLWEAIEPAPTNPDQAKWAVEVA